jgi:hypothetical protein
MTDELDPAAAVAWARRHFSDLVAAQLNASENPELAAFRWHSAYSKAIAESSVAEDPIVGAFRMGALVYDLSRAVGIMAAALAAADGVGPATYVARYLEFIDNVDDLNSLERAALLETVRTQGSHQ